MVDFTLIGHEASTVVVENRSTITGKINTMTFDMSIIEYNNCFALWEDGALIQNAFPMLNADEREFLMTGMTPDDWNNVVSQVDVSDCCEEEDKWIGDDYELIEDCYQS